MRKKLLIVLLVIFGMFAITACGDTEDSGNKTNTKAQVKDGIKYKDLYFVFDRSQTNNEMHFKYSDDFSLSGYNSFTGVTYNDEISIRLNYFENVTLDEAKKTMFDGAYEEIEMNNIKWYKGTFTVNDGGDGTLMSVYITEYNSKIYLYMINKNDDTKAVEEAFLKGITFE